MSVYVDDYLDDLGPDDADITSHDTYTAASRTRRSHGSAATTRCRGGTRPTARASGPIPSTRDALEVSRNVETFTSTKGIRLEEMDDEQIDARSTLMELDPPEHTRLRRLVNKGFTRRTVETYEESIRELVISVLEQALDQRPLRLRARRVRGAADADARPTARNQRRGRPPSSSRGATLCSATPTPSSPTSPST